MEDFPHYFDIVLFAMVAVFLVLRLRSVLGRRTGNERRRELIRRVAPRGSNVVAFGNRGPAASALRTEALPGAGGVEEGLRRISAVDASFDPRQFIGGARVAFEQLVEAFAAGDKARLRPLLSDEVFGPFATAIDERNAAGERLETRIAQLKEAEIVEAGLSGRAARVTVKFVSDQVHVLRAHDGSVVDGDPDQTIEKTDFWTFVRDTRSADPNWVLVATASG